MAIAVRGSEAVEITDLWVTVETPLTGSFTVIEKTGYTNITINRSFDIIASLASSTTNNRIVRGCKITSYRSIMRGMQYDFTAQDIIDQ